MYYKQKNVKYVVVKTDIDLMVGLYNIHTKIPWTHKIVVQKLLFHCVLNTGPIVMELALDLFLRSK